jgi:uncharacterized membrane protein (DUF4010 family)
VTLGFESHALLSVSVALGIGLLIGAERERRKGRGSHRAAAGVRTFAVAALAGAVAMLVGDLLLIAVVTLLIGGFAMLAYHRGPTKDPGMTTEIAIVLTCLIGGLAVQKPLFAGAVGVVLAGLLAARKPIHHFVRRVLSERELHDGLLFAAAVLIALPLSPDRLMGPFAAINPRALASIVVLVMLVSALGYIALRVLGARLGLPMAGFAGGFISSTATIFAMGQRTRSEPALMSGLVAGAVLSSLATIVQLAAVLAFLAPSLLVALSKSLLFAGVAAAVYAGWFTWQAMRQEGIGTYASTGRAFDLQSAFGLAGLIGVVALVSAALNAWIGDSGVIVTVAVAGLADAHSAAAAAASLYAANKINSPLAVLAVLAGLSTNTLTKAVVAITAGGWTYARRIIPGLVLMIAAAWIGMWI